MTDQNIKDFSNPADLRRKTGNRYRQKYHATVPTGWANDPNGWIVYNGTAHLFYQHNPYKPSWDTMHWGHMISKDMIHWEDCPIALVPTEEYEIHTGCFSGTSIIKDGKHVLMYTGVSKEYQEQCLAFSEDGIHFDKYKGNPVIGHDQLPKQYPPQDFRDPKVFVKDGYYWCLCGSRTEKYGNILLFRSEDMLEWTYIGSLFDPEDESCDHCYRLGGVCECPDYQVIDGQEVLAFSAQNADKEGNLYENSHSVIYMIGTLDFETGIFHYTYKDEVDGGFDFYAPQMTKDDQGRVLMISWKEMWHNYIPTAEDGWAGSFTVPSELSVRDGRLCRRPVRELDAVCRNAVSFDLTVNDGECISAEGIEGNVIRLQAEIELGDSEETGIHLLCGHGHHTEIKYNTLKKQLIMDRTNSGIPINGRDSNTSVRTTDLECRDGILKLDILVDVCAIEAYVNDGIAVMTANAYADPVEDIGIRFFAKGGSVHLKGMKTDVCA